MVVKQRRRAGAAARTQRQLPWYETRRRNAVTRALDPAFDRTRFLFKLLGVILDTGERR